MSGSDALVQEYCASIREHSEAIERSDSTAANAAFDRIIAALGSLRALPDRGLSCLLACLTSENPNIRLAAATHLLPLDKRAAKRELRSLAKLKGMAAFNAGMVLEQWNSGNLEIP